MEWKVGYVGWRGLGLKRRAAGIAAAEQCTWLAAGRRASPTGPTPATSAEPHADPAARRRGMERAETVAQLSAAVADIGVQLAAAGLAYHGALCGAAGLITHGGPWGSHRTPLHPVEDPLDPLQMAKVP